MPHVSFLTRANIDEILGDRLFCFYRLLIFIWFIIIFLLWHVV